MNWEFRREILEFAHRWQLVFLAFLLGSLLGFGLVYLFPAPYRAEAGLAVIFNPDVNPRNPDDYKNWFLEQLDVFILSDGVLDETLERLRVQDSEWNTVSRQELRTSLHAYWRSAGQWRLVAELDQANAAEQASRAWREAILENTALAITASARMEDIDHRYQEVVKLEATTGVRLTELEKTHQALQAWSAAAQKGNLTAPLDTLERWRLLTLAARVVEPNPVELSLLEALPPSEAGVESYLPWVNQLQVALEQALSALQSQKADLAQQREALTRSWTEAFHASGGLSRHLMVEALTAADSPAKPVRTPATGALLGGVVGALGWMLLWLARPLRKVNHE